MQLELPSAKPLRPLSGHKGAVLCCCVHESWFVTAGHDKRIIIWDANTGKVKLEILGHEHIISGLDVYSGNKCKDPVNEPYILSASWDKSVKVWNLRTGSLISKFTGHDNRVKCVKALIETARASASPKKGFADNQNGAMAASGDDDGNIHVWNLLTGDALLYFDEHSRFVVRLVSYIDSSSGVPCLASVSADATIRLWEVSPHNSAPGQPNQSTLMATSSPASERKSLSKAPNKNSLCAIKTPSKHLSALCVTHIAASSPLITGPSGPSSPGSRSPLPPISPTRAHSTSHDHASHDVGAGIEAQHKMESIIIAGDTLGVIFIHRAQTGALLARLETRCKITELFATNEMINTPYFPNDEQNTVASAFLSPERSAVLVQAANMKRQQSIVNKLTNSPNKHASSPRHLHSSSYLQEGGSDSHLQKYLYYVPDNGSIGSFCLTPDMSGAITATDILSSVTCTHIVSTQLSQLMSPLGASASKNTTISATNNGATPGSAGAFLLGPLSCQSSSFDLDDPGDATSLTSTTNSMRGRLMSGLSNNNLEDDASVATANNSVTRRTPLVSSASERHIPTVTAESSGAKLRKSSTYSHGMSPGVAMQDTDNTGVSTAAGTGAGGSGTSGKVLQAFNSSAKPSSRMLTSNSVTSLSVTNSATGSKKLKSTSSSSGGVMSVSINTAAASSSADATSAAFPLLQCFAMTPYTALVQRHFVLLGGREGVLLSSTYCPEFPSVNNPTLAPLNPIELSVQGNKTHLDVVHRPAPIQVRQSTLPPLNSTSPSHLSDYKSSSGSTSSLNTPKHVTPTTRKPALMSVDSFHGSAYVECEPLVDFVMQEMQRQSPTPPVNMPHAPATTTGAEGRHCIKKTVSEDDVTQSELSHIMHYYDHLIGDREQQGHGTRGDGHTVDNDAKNTYNSSHNASSAHTETLLDSLQSHLHSTHLTNDAHMSHLHAAAPGERVPTADSDCSTEFAAIVGSSTLDPQFWQAANDAKSTYSFRRIKLNNNNTSSPKHRVAPVHHHQYQLTQDFTTDDATVSNNASAVSGAGHGHMQRYLASLVADDMQNSGPGQGLDNNSIVSYNTHNVRNTSSRRGRGAYVNVSERAEAYARIANLNRGADNSNQSNGSYGNRPATTTLHAINTRSLSSKSAPSVNGGSNNGNNIKYSATAYQKNTEMLRPL